MYPYLRLCEYSLDKMKVAFMSQCVLLKTVQISKHTFGSFDFLTFLLQTDSLFGYVLWMTIYTLIVWVFYNAFIMGIQYSREQKSIENFVFRPKMAIFRRAEMREGGLPLPLAFQYLILMIWRACDLNLVILSSLASK